MTWAIRRHTNRDVPQTEDSHDPNYVVEQINGPDTEWITVVPRVHLDALLAVVAPIVDREGPFDIAGIHVALDNLKTTTERVRADLNRIPTGEPSHDD